MLTDDDAMIELLEQSTQALDQVAKQGVSPALKATIAAAATEARRAVVDLITREGDGLPDDMDDDVYYDPASGKPLPEAYRNPQTLIMALRVIRDTDPDDIRRGAAARILSLYQGNGLRYATEALIEHLDLLHY